MKREAVEVTTQLVVALGEQVQNVTAAVTELMTGVTGSIEVEGEKAWSLWATVETFLIVSGSIDGETTESSIGNVTTVTDDIAKASMGADQSPVVVFTAVSLALVMILGIVVMYIRWYVADQRYERKRPVFDDNETELVPMNNIAVSTPAAVNNLDNWRFVDLRE